jgi:predicted Rdx family selenoprotein
MTNRKLIIVLFSLFASIAGVVSGRAAVTEAWVRIYDFGSDGGGWVGIDASGNVVTGGNSERDFYIVKYSGTDGALLWERRHDGSTNTADSLYAMALDPSGNVVVTGTLSQGTSSNDWYTAKYAAANGALLWERRFSAWTTIGYPAGGGLAVDKGGNVIVTGVVDGDMYTAKFAGVDGALLWEKLFSTGLAFDHGRAVAVDSSGNVIVTGGVNRVTTDSDYYTAKYAGENGALLWEHRYNGPSNSFDGPTAVAVDAIGNVAVTGISGHDVYTAKYAAANGALLWERRYSGPPSGRWQSGLAVAVDRHGNVVVTGYAGNPANDDYYTAKYAAADGALLWERRYDGPGNSDDMAGALALDANDNVVVTGRSEASTNFYSGDIYTAKYSAADGALLWERRYNGTLNQLDGGGRVAIAPNGMIVVAASVNITESQSSGDGGIIAYREDLSPLVINVTSGDVRLRMNGAPGRTYELQRAASIAGPWTTIATVTAPSSGLMEFVEATPPTGSLFYRARTE